MTSVSSIEFYISNHTREDYNRILSIKCIGYGIMAKTNNNIDLLGYLEFTSSKRKSTLERIIPGIWKDREKCSLKTINYYKSIDNYIEFDDSTRNEFLLEISEKKEEKEESANHLHKFILKANNIDIDKFIDFLNELCKKWRFQLEEKDGELYYKGFLSLLTRKRKSTLENIFLNYFKCRIFKIYEIKEKIKFSPFLLVSTEEGAKLIKSEWNYFFPKKIDCVIHNLDNPILRPWQQYILNDLLQNKQSQILGIPNIDNKYINFIFNQRPYNSPFKMGLTFFTSYLAKIHIYNINIGGHTNKILSNAKNEILEHHNLLYDQGGFIFIIYDGIKSLDRLLMTIEYIKDGTIYRGNGTFYTPSIWIFHRRLPKVKSINPNLYKFWKVNNDYELIEYKRDKPQSIDT